VILWLNGAFGAGKSSTARELADLMPASTLYDPGPAGRSLLKALPASRRESVADFPELPSWRRLVVETAAALLAEAGGTLLVPMALLNQDHRDEIFGALAARRIPVRHVLLHAEETILRDRIKRRADHPQPTPGAPRDPARDPARADPEPAASAWRLDRLDAYQDALPWLTRDAHVIDTAELTPRETAERVAAAVAAGAGACDIVQTPEPTGETLAAGVLLFDDADRVLLVDPTYKPGWEFPGGVVERGEPPSRAAVREVAEELGVDLGPADALRLLVVDWEPPRAPRFGGLRLLFDGGRLSAERAAGVLLPAAELRGWRFVTEREAAGLLPPERLARLRWALHARRHGTTLNLEAGRPLPRPRE
jgi:8-oxo-dGTP pyrophosphatase MutT (NUDIX family)/predicted kinase